MLKNHFFFIDLAWLLPPLIDHQAFFDLLAQLVVAEAFFLTLKI